MISYKKNPYGIIIGSLTITNIPFYVKPYYRYARVSLISMASTVHATLVFSVRRTTSCVGMSARRVGS